MTYKEIVAALHKDGKFFMTASALERAVNDEAKALAELPDGKWSRGGKFARESAEEFYAEDITEQLADPKPPTSTRLLTLRRFGVAWAVAEVMRTNNLVPALTAPSCATCRDVSNGIIKQCPTHGNKG